MYVILAIKDIIWGQLSGGQLSYGGSCPGGGCPGAVIRGAVVQGAVVLEPPNIPNIYLTHKTCAKPRRSTLQALAVEFVKSEVES